VGPNQSVTATDRRYDSGMSVYETAWLGRSADNAQVGGGSGGAFRRRLDLEVALTGEFGMPDYLPVLKILVDGRELLRGPFGPEQDTYYGPPPSALLDDDVPLLPDQLPRRIALLYLRLR
jgi:hypothetical protein